MSASTDFCIKQQSVIEFLTQNIAIGDKSWVHHYDPGNKRQSKEYCHPGSPSVKKFKTLPSAKNLTVSALWKKHRIMDMSYTQDVYMSHGTEYDTI
jgi:hypothetical protein